MAAALAYWGLGGRRPCVVYARPVSITGFHWCSSSMSHLERLLGAAARRPLASTSGNIRRNNIERKETRREGQRSLTRDDGELPEDTTGRPMRRDEGQQLGIDNPGRKVYKHPLLAPSITLLEDPLASSSPASLSPEAYNYPTTIKPNFPNTS